MKHPRSISSRRSFQEKGCIGREDLGSRTVKDEDRARGHKTSMEASSLLQKRRNGGQMFSSEVDLVDGSKTTANITKVGVPKSWASFTMDGMIADILSQREQ